ncbi:hypothetical protein NDU88_002483 [Pleurodeles waltl]|uniref:Uncharacterized protein n=1 Tax=Pleurodeles waltl TaxID=8319 RepID=A0AAV7KVU7_PLEWA|nr:hypothetical protein NDU88_002483 [Pleurodeles waltl]
MNTSGSDARFKSSGSTRLLPLRGRMSEGSGRPPTATSFQLDKFPVTAEQRKNILADFYKRNALSAHLSTVYAVMSKTEDAYEGELPQRKLCRVFGSEKSEL